VEFLTPRGHDVGRSQAAGRGLGCGLHRFKGFNQPGVSEIIAATDPRRQSREDAFESVKYETIGSRSDQ